MIKETTPAPTGDESAQAASPPRESLSVKQLAQAVLHRTLRPRTSEIRRLAEAVLERAKPAKKKKDKKPKEAKAEGKGGPKKRKQAKIPAKQARPN